jgi:histidinol phosphatase-like enzyme
MVARVACDSYYTLQVADVQEDRSEHEKRVWEYLKEHMEQLLACRKSAFDEVVKATNRENDNCDITKEEVLMWLKAMRQKYENVTG